MYDDAQQMGADLGIDLEELGRVLDLPDATVKTLDRVGLALDFLQIGLEYVAQELEDQVDLWPLVTGAETIGVSVALAAVQLVEHAAEREDSADGRKLAEVLRQTLRDSEVPGSENV